MLDNFNSDKWLPALMGALGLILLLALLTAYIGSRASGASQSRAFGVRLLNERLGAVADAATRAGNGESAGYQQLAELTEEVASARGIIAGGGIEAGLPENWQAFNVAMSALLDARDKAQGLPAAVDQAIIDAGIFSTAMNRMSATLLGSRWSDQRDSLEQAAGIAASAVAMLRSYKDGQLQSEELRLQIGPAIRNLASKIEELLGDQQFGGQAAGEVNLDHGRRDRRYNGICATDDTARVGERRGLVADRDPIRRRTQG